jgi:cell division protein FtsA
LSKEKAEAGIDVGGGQVTCCVGERDERGLGLRILGGASEPCRGVKGGVVLNIPETARSIRRAVEKAEEQAKREVRGVYLGVRGKHLEGANSHGGYNIARTDKEITSEDAKAVVDNARAISISPDREILHIVPQGFSIDRQRGVPDPVGMEGSLLEVDVHIVTATTCHLNNLNKAVAQAGFEVIEPVYSPLALGELVVTPEERDVGCLLLDIGSQTISLAIYSEGSVKFTKELDFGAELITRDISHSLRTNIQTAERIKIERGAAHPKFGGPDEEIDFVGVDGRSARKARSSSLIDVVLPRVEEIFDLVKGAVDGSSFADVAVPGGAILSGGGAMLRGMPEACGQILEMSARLGLVLPGAFEADERFFEQPAFSSALGLLAYPRTGLFENSRRVDWIGAGGPGFLGDIKRLFKDLL